MRAWVLLVWAALNGLAASAPQRIVSLSPDISEILYGIGAFDQVVGVTDYCSYPPSVNKLTRVGGWATPNLEKIVALRPDLVVVDAAQAPLVEQKLKDLGLRVVSAPDRRVQDVYRAMSILGQATGHERQAAQAVESTRAGLERLAQKASRYSKPSVVITIDRTPGTLRDVYTATEGSFLAELVTIAGGRMAVHAAENGYGKLSKEDLMAANPDLILDFVHGAAGKFSGDPLEPWREMPELKAVRANRVFEVTQDFVVHASQRMVQTAELFLHYIHPEAG